MSYFFRCHQNNTADLLLWQLDLVSCSGNTGPVRIWKIYQTQWIPQCTIEEWRSRTSNATNWLIIMAFPTFVGIEPEFPRIIDSPLSSFSHPLFPFFPPFSHFFLRSDIISFSYRTSRFPLLSEIGHLLILRSDFKKSDLRMGRCPISEKNGKRLGKRGKKDGEKGKRGLAIISKILYPARPNQSCMFPYR